MNAERSKVVRWHRTANGAYCNAIGWRVTVYEELHDEWRWRARFQEYGEYVTGGYNASPSMKQAKRDAEQFLASVEGAVLAEGRHVTETA